MNEIKYLCRQCGKEFILSSGTLYMRRYKNLDIDICSVCIKSNNGKKQWKNMTNEEKLNLKNAHSKYYKNMTIEEKANRKKYLSDIRRQLWNSMSEDDKLIHSIKTKEGMKNMSDEAKLSMNNNRNTSIHNESSEDKFMRYNKVRETFMLKPKEDQDAIMKKLQIANQKWRKSLTANEAMQHIQKIKDYWKNIPEYDYLQWNNKRIEGLKKYYSNIDTAPNKNELSFINSLTLLSIKYIYQYYNIRVPDDFYLVFNINPVNGNNVSQYHAWDFKIDITDKSILVDVDGSIHDPNMTNYMVTSPNGIKFKLSDYIAFNDSKRPYQTDGLDWYIIQCYDDKLTDDTKVLVGKTNEIIKYKQFLEILIYHNISITDKKKGK